MPPTVPAAVARLDVLWAECVTIHPHPSLAAVAPADAFPRCCRPEALRRPPRTARTATPHRVKGTAQIRPERITPHSSQIPSTPEAKNPNDEIDVQPEHVRPRLREDADQARPDQPARRRSARSRAGSRRRRACASGRRAPCGRSRSRSRPPAPARASRRPGRAAPRPSARAAVLSRRARPTTRRGVKRSSISAARVRPRDLEDVELRVELDADRADRRDRLVEHHEPRRQPQVHRVDQRRTPPGSPGAGRSRSGSSRSSASRSWCSSETNCSSFSFG